MRKRLSIDWEKKYSHESEDYILRMLLPYEEGTYVEIGVNNPKHSSNSYIFYEFGWSGLMIEPLPFWNRMGKMVRPRDIYVQCAVSNEDDQVLDLWLHGDNGPATSFREDWGLTGTKLKVKTKKLSTILKDHPQYNKPDFCSLDVEGWERQAIEGIDFSTFRPTVFCVEAVRWRPFYRMHQEWEPMLFEQNYKLICHNLQNRFYGVAEDVELWENVKQWNLEE